MSRLGGEVFSENTDLENATNDAVTSNKRFNTLAFAITSTVLNVGDRFNVRERKVGTGGSAYWRVVLKATVTISIGAPGIGNIVASTGDTSLAFVLENVKFPGFTNIEEFINPRAWGAESTEVGPTSGFNNSPVTQLIVNHATTNASGMIHWNNGRFYFAENTNIPVVNDSVGTNGITFQGAARNATEFFTDQNIDMFTHQDNFCVKDMTIFQRGATGVTEHTGVAFRSNGQCRFCRFENLAIFRFKFGHLQRFSLWNYYRNVSWNGNLCGVKLARNDDMEDQTNPSPLNGWNVTTKNGTHTGANNASILTDTTESFIVNSLIGITISNTTDGSSGTITANTATTVTATLSGGTDNDWDTADKWSMNINGWFHNKNTFDTCVWNGDKESSGGRGEIGLWAALQGCHLNNVTFQNYERDGSIPNQTIPIGQVSTCLELVGGGPTSSNTFENEITALYIERSFKGLKVADHRELIINGWFQQGQTGGENLLECDNSTIRVTAQTGQSAGWAQSIVATDSNVTFDRPIVASIAGRTLTNSFLSENGIPIPETIKTFAVTMAPETGGTITIDTSADLIAAERQGGIVHFTGRLDALSVSSPTGTFITVEGLPFQVGNVTERAGNAAVSVVMFGGAVSPIVLPAILLENASAIRIFTDVTLLTGGEEFYLNGSYFTTEFS